MLHATALFANLSETNAFILDEIFHVMESQPVGGVSKIRLGERVIYIVGESHSPNHELDTYFNDILSYENALLIEEGRCFTCPCEKCHSKLGIEDIVLHKACLNIIDRNIAFKCNTCGKEKLPYPQKTYFEEHDHLKNYLNDYQIFVKKPQSLLLEIISEPRNKVFVQNIQKILAHTNEEFIVIRIGEMHRSYITLNLQKKHPHADFKISPFKKVNEILHKNARREMGIYTLSKDTETKEISYKNALYYLKVIQRNQQCEEISNI